MTISRRRFLRAQAVLLPLPFLPSLAAASLSAALRPSQKLVILYVPNGIVRRTFFPGEESANLPGFIGGFDAERSKADRRRRDTPGIHQLSLTPTLQPLAEHAADITLVTGLDRSFKQGQDVHAQAASCFLTSVSPEQAAARGLKHPNGRSLDHVIGDAIGHESVFRTLEISCNGFTAPKEPIEFDNISWYGPGRIAPAIREPRKLYERLFVREDYRRHVHDVTDLVLADAAALSRRLSRDDRATLAEFLEMVRGIERRIAKMEKLLADIDIDLPKLEMLPRGEYIRLQVDLMLLALRAGITNVSTFMIGPERWDATLMYEGVFGKPVDHHNMTHNQRGNGYMDVAKIDLFHMQQYAYLLRRMKEIRESDGSSLLDNSVVAFGAGLGDGATHQFYDLPVVLAGRAQGRLKQGRMVALPSGTLNSNLWLTIARLMGLDIESYADSTGVLTDLCT